MVSLTDLAARYPRGTPVTLRRILGGKEHKTFLAPYLNRTGVVVNIGSGASGPAVFVRFGEGDGAMYLWLREGEVEGVSE